MSDEQFTGPVRVDNVELSKTGKSWRVSLGGKWYGAYKDSGILDALQKSIYVITGTLEKGGPWIMKWKVADQTTALAAPPSAPRSTPGPNVAPWWMAFTSNTVAHALRAGLIKAPAEINVWAKEAKECAVALAAMDEEDVPY